MATKNTKKTSTRVSKKSKGPSTKLKIWVGVLIVLIVAVVGVVVVRFSEAGVNKQPSSFEHFDATVNSVYESNTQPRTLTLIRNNGKWYTFVYAGSRDRDRARLYYAKDSDICAVITKNSDFKPSINGEVNYKKYDAVHVWPQQGRSLFVDYYEMGLKKVTYENACYAAYTRGLWNPYKVWWDNNGKISPTYQMSE